MMQKNWKMIGYSSESTQQELSNEYQHDRVLDDFQNSLRPSAVDVLKTTVFFAHFVNRATQSSA